MNDRYDRRVLWLFAVAAIVLAAGMGLRDPWPPDEPRFALIARDMVQSGNWLIPRVAGVLYPDKPPLFFWLVAVACDATGSIRTAFLLPTFVSGLVVLWLVYDLARRLWGREKALWTAAVLLSVLQFPLQMKAGQIDGLLCLWTTLGLYGFCRHLLLGPAWRWYTVAGFSCGLGVITKGVGFLPFLVLLPYTVAYRKRWPLPAIDWRRGKWLLAPSAFVLALALWLLPMLLVTSGSADPELLQYRDNILLKQTVTRYADAWGHLKPPWYLFTNAAPWLWMPVSLLLPWLVPAWHRELKMRTPATLLLGGWILLVLLFFSISDGKRSVYIFPAVPAVALLAGHHVPIIAVRTGARRMLFGLALLLASLPLAIGSYALATPGILEEWVTTTRSAAQLAWITMAIGLLAISVAGLCRARRAAFALGAVLVVLWTAVPLFVYPMIDASRSGAVVTDAAAATLGDDQVLGFAAWKEQLLLQWNRPAVHFGHRRNDNEGESRDAASWLATDPANRLLLPESTIDPCFDRRRLTDLAYAHRHRWYLAGRSSIRPACDPDAGVTRRGHTVFYDPASHVAPMDRSFKSAR